MGVLRGIVLLIAIFGCIPYAIWLITTACKRRWKKLGLQLGIPFVGFLLLLGATKITDSLAYERYLRNTYDVDVDLGQPLYQYDFERAFNGDGYSMTVYNLPNEIKTRFESADERLLKDFPKLPGYRDRWTAKRWRASPVDNESKPYLSFALMGGDSSAETHQAALRSALSGDSAYYAYFHYDHSDNPGNVDFFVVDLKNDLLYVINLNT